MTSSEQAKKQLEFIIESVSAEIDYSSKDLCKLLEKGEVRFLLWMSILSPEEDEVCELNKYKKLAKLSRHKEEFTLYQKKVSSEVNRLYEEVQIKLKEREALDKVISFLEKKQKFKAIRICTSYSEILNNLAYIIENFDFITGIDYFTKDLDDLGYIEISIRNDEY